MARKAIEMVSTLLYVSFYYRFISSSYFLILMVQSKQVKDQMPNHVQIRPQNFQKLEGKVNKRPLSVTAVICDQCGVWYQYEEQLSAHMERKHAGRPMPTLPDLVFEDEDCRIVEWGNGKGEWRELEKERIEREQEEAEVHWRKVEGRREGERSRAIERWSGEERERRRSEGERGRKVEKKKGEEKTTRRRDDEERRKKRKTEKERDEALKRREEKKKEEERMVRWRDEEEGREKKREEKEREEVLKRREERKKEEEKTARGREDDEGRKKREIEKRHEETKRREEKKREEEEQRKQRRRDEEDRRKKRDMEKKRDEERKRREEKRREEEEQKKRREEEEQKKRRIEEAAEEEKRREENRKREEEAEQERREADNIENTPYYITQADKLKVELRRVKRKWRVRKREERSTQTLSPIVINNMPWNRGVKKIKSSSDIESDQERELLGC